MISLPAQSSRMAVQTMLSPLRPTLRKHLGQRHRDLVTSSSRPQGNQLGRIKPKRIAISVPRGTLEASELGLPQASIWRPVVFCAVVGVGGYVFAAQYTNHDTAQWAKRLGSGAWWRRGRDQPTDREILRAKTLEGAKRAQENVDELPKKISFLPQVIRTPILRIYISTVEYFLNTPPAHTVPMGVIGVMGTVFLAWKVRRWEPFMRRWWLHRPVVFSSSVSKKWQESVTLFTSTLSHQALPHFAFNSIALYSFGGAAFSYLASNPPDTVPLPSSTYAPHFLAFLLTAGLASSLASHLWTNLFRLPRLLKALQSPARLSSPQALAAHEAILPSLGASGAIYAAVTLTACAYPNSSVSLIFLPFVSIPVGMGVGGLVLLDVIGLIRGWRMFDHVAHLGGAVFGVLYYQYGREVWIWLRRTLGGREQGSGYVSA